MRHNLLAGLTTLVLASSLMNCSSCGQANTDGEATTSSSGNGPVGTVCTDDSDCAGGACTEGLCTMVNRRDGGVSSSGGAQSSGGNSSNGGTSSSGEEPRGILEITPSPVVEFGAQRVGTPVSMNVFARNTGNAALTIFVVYVDNNPSMEFTAEPSGTLNRTLAPGEEAIIRVTHTPVDGTPDTSQLKFVHSAQPDMPSEVTLQAVFKGVPQLSLTDVVTSLSPNIAQEDLGLTPLGTSVTRRLFVRNAGAANSVLTISNVTLTPLTAGYSVTHADVGSGLVLSSFNALCASDSQCPATHPTCSSMVCVDGSGVPPDTFVIDIEFAPASAGMSTAILTIVHSDGTTPSQTSVDLLGEGGLGQLAVTPGMLNLGTVFVGRSAMQDVTLTNTGNADIVLDAPVITGSATVTVVNPEPITLAPNATRTVSVSVTPTGPGDIAATLQLRGTDVTPVDVPVSAIGRLEPTIVVDSALPFGGVYVGQSVARQISVRNSGPGVLNVQSVMITGPNADRFSVSPTSFPDPLAPLAQPSDPAPAITLTVTYLPVPPVNLAEQSATLTIVSDDPDSPRTDVTLTGTGIRPSAVAQPTSLDFGMVRLGAPPSTKTVQLFNNGLGPLTLTGLSVPMGSPFTITSAPVADTQVELGAPVDIVLSFTPQAVGPASDVLTIRTNDLARPVITVNLAGAGTQGALTPSPTTLDFGTIFVGRSLTRTVTLTNTGTAQLAVQGASIMGSADYRVLPSTLPATLAVGASQVLTIELAPSSEMAPIEGTLRVTTDAGMEVVVALTGAGRLEPAILAPTTLDFGLVDTRSSSTRPISIRNTGPGVLNVTRLSVTGPGASRFSITPTSFSTPLDPLGLPSDATPNLVLQVTYQPVAPTSGNADNAIIHIESDDPDVPDHQVQLSGLGIHPNVSVSPTTVAFGDQKVTTTSSTRQVRIGNVVGSAGSGPLQVTDIQVTGGTFALVSPPALPATVSVNSTLDVDLTFTPVTTGNVSGTLTIRTSDLSSPAVTVTLTGNGTQGAIGISPPMIAFTETFTNRSQVRTVTVTNMGTASMAVMTAGISPSGAFVVEGFAPTTLNPMQSMMFLVRYAPTSEGSHAGTLTVAGELGAMGSIMLTGTSRFEPTIAVPPSLAFGQVDVRTSATLMIPIRNLGPGLLNISQLSITGAGAARFSLNPSSFMGPLLAVAQPTDPNPNFGLSVTYQPTATTGVPDTATVEIRSDDPDVPVATVALSGMGIRPVISVSPLTVTLPEATVGTQAPTRDVTVTNTGAGPLVVNSATLPAGSPFTANPVVGMLPRTLNPGASMTLRIGFVPPSAGNHTATLTINSTDLSSSNVTVALNGSGARCVDRPFSTYVQTGAACAYSCVANRHDLNGDLNAPGQPGVSNGCEYACTFQSSTDLPDNAFVDANCDGIDGNPNNAIFVATTGNNGNPGTMAAPVADIVEGISKAQAAGKTQVYVSDGTYAGRVDLANGVSIYGGFSASNGWARSDSYVSVIRSNMVIGSSVIAVRGVNITAATTIDHLTIRTDPTMVTRANNYAMFCDTCSGLTLRSSVLEAGNAGPGVAGTSGNNFPGIGFNGGNGAVSNGDTNGSGMAGGGAGTSQCSRTGGAGGRGGPDGSNAGQAGGTGVGPTAGGAGGGGGDPGRAGGNGATGSTGAPGTNGGAGSGGAISSGEWSGNPGGVGQPGNPGNGGGGGGGGGGQGCTFCDNGQGNGGGGGGGGGCGGQEATGGTAGGASFGLLLINSTGATLSSNSITSGTGGAGGAGGNGGPGGAGGTGGVGGQGATNEVGAGGNGGAGGAGGRGGHGGGGAGGPSYAVYRVNSSVLTTGNTLTNGSGGAGGTSLGNPGATGASGPVF